MAPPDGKARRKDKMDRQSSEIRKNTRYKTEITPGQEIVVTGCIALTGTLRLIACAGPRLRTRLSAEYLEEAQRALTALQRPDAGAGALACGASFAAEVGEGGILTALWELAAVSGHGLTVRLRDIPIRQETVEVCEVLGLNPYYLLSGGCSLVTAENGGRLARMLAERGTEAAVIGSVTAGKDKILLGASGRGFLNRPQEDEYIRFCAGRRE